MTFKQTLDKIESSQVFIDFKSNNKDLVLCAGFFVIDTTNDSIAKTLDYLVNEKVFTFTINEDETVSMQEDKLQVAPESVDRPKLSKIEPTTNIDPEELKGIAGIEVLDNGIKSKFQKIIAVLQNYKGEETNQEEIQIWNLTCILEDLIIVHMLINSKNKEIIKFERKNLMDWIRRVD